MTTMRPIRAIATGLLVASLALAGCATREPTTPGSSAAPTTVAPTTTPPSPPTPSPEPPGTSAQPPSPAEAVASAVAFLRREVGMTGMTDPVAGPFRWTGARTGQVDIRARGYADVNPPRGPVTTVSLQRLRTVWYVLGTRTTAIGVVSPRPQDPIRSPVELLVSAQGRVHVRITQDRYGKDLELGSGDLVPHYDSSDLNGQVTFRSPSGPTGSVVLTMASGHEGQPVCATVVRVRLATSQPPRIEAVRAIPQLSTKDGIVQLPAVVTFQVTATRAERARLIYTPTGTGAAWYAQVVAQDSTASNGLRLTWAPKGAWGQLAVEVLGPGGTARHDIGQVLSV
jgi:hypothetical protein